MPNDFQEFWAKTWKPISVKCLNIAKHKFIMRKSFELFKAHCVLNEFKNGNICFLGRRRLFRKWRNRYFTIIMQACRFTRRRIHLFWLVIP